jgi:single-strand DNA-binding protein
MYNKVFLIGNLTRDPELRYTTAGVPVAHFTLAVNRVRRKGGEADPAGEEPSRTDAYSDVDFINVVAWRRLAEICGEFLKKGRPVAIEGRLQIRSYVGKDGQKRTIAEVTADNMQMLGKREGQEGREGKEGHEGREGDEGQAGAAPLTDNEAVVEEAPF